MDHGCLKTRFFGIFSLRIVGLLSLSFILAACAGKSQPASPRVVGPAKTVLASDLSPRKLFETSEKYLEYHLGYSLLIRDLERGLIVSDWASESGLERQQVTLRIASNDKGSLVSAHMKTEGFIDGGWKDLPSSGEREAMFLDKLDKYLHGR